MVEGQPVFNPTAALARLGGDTRLFQDLIGFLHEDAPPLLVRLREAVARADADQVARAAHSLKGLVVNFDAHTAAAAAQKVESMGLSGDLSGAAADVETLALHVAELEQHLREYTARG
jgi:HPt (histidine-containing phosphotransfer) domain-containing protein